MPIFKFRIVWTEDDNIVRDIEILSSQSYYLLHDAIKQAFALKPEWHASIAVIDDTGKRGYTLHSAVEKNIKGAPALSASKTPIGALINMPHQQFVYALENPHEWDFLIELITIDRSEASEADYPRLVRKEGLHPTEIIKGKGKEKDAIAEVEEKYDLPNAEDDEDSGFGVKDEDGEDESAGDEFGAEENYDDL
jgi:hypothetical protein